MQVTCKLGHPYTYAQLKDGTVKRRCRVCERDKKRQHTDMLAAAPRIVEPVDPEWPGEELHQFLAQRAHDSLVALADHECEHGKLPGDRGITCGCWVVA